MSKLDEFLAIRIPAHAKLVTLFLATRPAQRFTHQQVALATHIHQADVEQAALNLLRGDETPFHPIVFGNAADFIMPDEHALRVAFADQLNALHGVAPAAAVAGEQLEEQPASEAEGEGESPSPASSSRSSRRANGRGGK